MTNIIIIKNYKKNSVDLLFQQKKYRCIAGLNGISYKKREGDKLTPKGTFLVKEIFYRHDRLGKIKTPLPQKRITRQMGWSYDSKSEKYNQLIIKPYRFSHEELYRDDCCYDIVITMNFNILKKRYKGSAIFFHCKRENQEFTDGCIAIEKEYLMQIIKHLSLSSKIIIR